MSVCVSRVERRVDAQNERDEDEGGFENRPLFLSLGRSEPFLARVVVCAAFLSDDDDDDACVCSSHKASSSLSGPKSDVFVAGKDEEEEFLSLWGGRKGKAVVRSARGTKTASSSRGHGCRSRRGDHGRDGRRGASRVFVKSARLFFPAE